MGSFQTGRSGCGRGIAGARYWLAGLARQRPGWLADCECKVQL